MQFKAQVPLVAESRMGTQVLYRWAQWHKQHAYPKALRIGVFRKESMRLRFISTEKLSVSR